TEQAQEAERGRLFTIIEDLVKWENLRNLGVLERARAEIIKSVGDTLPPVIDPFCGGGSIPLEAQRLGLTAFASDLNPVAALITKALIQLPAESFGLPPVSRVSTLELSLPREWRDTEGLAEDVRHYGEWMREEAARRMGDLYPKAQLPRDLG